MLRNLLIPVDDDATLAADLYLPSGDHPAPTLISFNPYRKDDIGGAFSAPWGERFAENGYAQLVVDARGTGGSSGDLNDNFAPREGADGAVVVEWAARQPWSDGSVAVWGMSSGGASALAVAAQRPPHLKAVATVDAYSDYYFDAAFPNGCSSCLGTARENYMLALALAPPGQQDPEGRWWRVWRERLERLQRGGIPAVRWQEHPNYDEYWTARAVDVEAITAPTFVIGAWRDLFPESMTRVYEQLRVPKRLLMGPWLHVAPDASPVEPIDWLGELLRWWDRWLREGKIAIDPSVIIYVQGLGGWRVEPSWPIARAVDKIYYLSDGGLDGVLPGSAAEDAHEADQRVGVRAGIWDPLGVGAAYPLEQGPDARASLTYTSEPFAQDFEITGSPHAALFVSLPEGGDCEFVAKLIDLAPNGTEELITTGWLRAAHRAGADQAKPLERSVAEELNIRLWATAYTLARGNRLRLSVSCSDFPRVWPSAINPRIRLHRGPQAPSRIVVPAIPRRADVATDPAMRRPEPGTARSAWEVSAAATWKITENLTGESVSVRLASHKELRPPDGLSFAVRHVAVATVARSRPDRARVRATVRIEMTLRGGEHVKVRTRSLFYRDRMAYCGDITIDGTPFFHQTWVNP